MSNMGGKRPEDEATLDPDNMPPRSRLFLVVPKTADGGLIQTEMARFPGMQYCKTDLIATKGIVFVKYSKSSSACLAMETVQASGVLAGYRVKIMLAEPKTKRSDSNPYLAGLIGGSQGMNLLPSVSSMASLSAPYGHSPMNSSLLSSLGSPGSLQLQTDFSGLGTFGALGTTFPHYNGMPSRSESSTPPLDQSTLGLGGFSLGGLGNANITYSSLSNHLASGMIGNTGLLGCSADASSSSSMGHLSRQRLFIVVHKAASEEAVAALFRSFPGMEYCDLKRDRATGRSKGYAYVSYTTPEAAAAAQMQLNGLEYPLGSGYRLKVMFAEPLGAATTQRTKSGSDTTSEGVGAGFIPTPAVEEGGSAGVHQFLTPSQGTHSQGTHSLHTPLTGESTALGSVGNAYPTSSTSSPLLSKTAAELVSSLQGGLAGMTLGTRQMSHENLVGANGHCPGHFATTSQESQHSGSPWRELSPDAAISHASPKGSGGSINPTHYIGDETVVYSALNRPLPEFALSHVFSQCGDVEFVRIMGDERIAMVKYYNSTAARRAVGQLDGAEVLGEILQVRASPPPVVGLQ